MRKPSIGCLPILALLLDGSRSADASNDDLKTNSRRHDWNEETSARIEQQSNIIKGAVDRERELQEADTSLRKVPPTVSKDDLRFPYQQDWKDKFLVPPSESPTTTPSVSAVPSATSSPSNIPSQVPSPLPSNVPSVSSVPSGASSSIPSDPPSTNPSSSPTKPVTYVPGKLTVFQNGLVLSEGLKSRIIARTNQNVRLASGTLSDEPFHEEPDGSSVFGDPDTGGWIYVSNSEQLRGEGGVGAIVFDKDGEVIDYKNLLRGTSRNCSGGKTPWNTWISCEEYNSGQIWQIDPQGIRSPEVTSISAVFGHFESFAYDIRDFNTPRFFVTEDTRTGALRRFTPSNPNWDDPWSLLHGDGTLEYLVLVPVLGDRADTSGVYYWTTDLNLARANAEFFYRYTEGLDVYDNEMFFVSKTQNSLFILDLDGNTYNRLPTNSGLFDGQPDQMKRLIKNGPSNIEFSSTFDANKPEEEPLLYFCEDSGEQNGIHARDANGWFYTILESSSDSRETSGLAFSPDGKHMYFSFQLQGIIFDVWREDGLPFYGKTLDVHYHQQQGR